MSPDHISRRQALRWMGFGGTLLLSGCATQKAELTGKRGVLRAASAFPDPPFEVEIDGVDTGFDAELMQQICQALGLTW